MEIGKKSLTPVGFEPTTSSAFQLITFKPSGKDGETDRQQTETCTDRQKVRLGHLYSKVCTVNLDEIKLFTNQTLV